ncbi:MAG: hypothetical protein AAGJ68_12785 [Pseudomonadota bacterium]
MAKSLFERLKNVIKDNIVDFLEVDPEPETPALETMSSSEILRRLKLRLGALEAERYRLRQALNEEAPDNDLDARAGAAVDAGDDRLAREILRLKVEQISTRTEANDALTELDLEAEDLQRLIALVDADEELDQSLEDRLAKYETMSMSSETETKEG